MVDDNFGACAETTGGAETVCDRADEHVYFGSLENELVS
jgi:hypothetical protein